MDSLFQALGFKASIANNLAKFFMSVIFYFAVVLGIFLGIFGVVFLISQIAP